MRLGMPEIKSISTGKFSQKISYERAKSRALTGRKNLALLLNDNRSESLTRVQLPGNEYSQARKYLSHHEESKDKLEKFNHSINNIKYFFINHKKQIYC